MGNRKLPEWVKGLGGFVGVVAMLWLLPLLGALWTGLFFSIVAGFFYLVIKYWWAAAPCLIALLAYAGYSITKAQRSARLKSEQEQAERHRLQEEQREKARLRGEAEIQARLEAERARLEADRAHRDEVRRFHSERLSIEPFVVGDPQAGIRSRYEVELTDREELLLKALHSKFDPSCLLVDTYLHRGDGKTTQVDVIAICRQGVIVIESKGFGGIMSGKRDDAEWIHKSSQVRIQNPILQNEVHVQAVYRALGMSEDQDEDDDDVLF